jgi:hypothetical protein
MEIAKLDGSLIDLEECMTLTDGLVASFRRGLDGMAARVTTDLGVRTKIDEVIFQILTGLADDSAKKSALLKAGKSLVAAEAADDADDEPDADDEEETGYGPSH